MTSLWWVRRDLRLADNPALHAALQRGEVVPVFVLDSHLLARTSARRQNFLFAGLHALNQELNELGSRPVIRSGSPEKALMDLLTQSGVQAVFAEEDFTPYARARDARIAQVPAGLIHAPWEKGIHVAGYPSKPLVDHALARERTLRAYNLSKSMMERVQ